MGMALLACGYAHTMVIVGAGKCGSVLTCGRAVTGQLGQEGTASGGGTLAAVKGPLAQVCEDIARVRQLVRCASACRRADLCAQKSWNAGPARTQAYNRSRGCCGAETGGCCVCGAGALDGAQRIRGMLLLGRRDLVCTSIAAYPVLPKPENRKPKRTRWRSANSGYAIAGAPGPGMYINRSVPCAP
jgi:hypothetical protein